jgi:hypothetical protein
VSLDSSEKHYISFWERLVTNCPGISYIGTNYPISRNRFVQWWHVISGFKNMATVRLTAYREFWFGYGSPRLQRGVRFPRLMPRYSNHFATNSDDLAAAVTACLRLRTLHVVGFGGPVANVKGWSSTPLATDKIDPAFVGRFSKVLITSEG